MNISPVLIGVIIAIVMVLTGYGVFQSTVDGAENSLFDGDDSLLGNAQSSGETENTNLNQDKSMGKGVNLLRRAEL